VEMINIKVRSSAEKPVRLRQQLVMEDGGEPN